MGQARNEWRASQGKLNPERLVFIDEIGAATDMARRYGRCSRGQRLVSGVLRSPLAAVMSFGVRRFPVYTNLRDAPDIAAKIK